MPEQRSTNIYNVYYTPKRVRPNAAISASKSIMNPVLQSSNKQTAGMGKISAYMQEPYSPSPSKTFKQKGKTI